MLWPVQATGALAREPPRRQTEDADSTTPELPRKQLQTQTLMGVLLPTGKTQGPLATPFSTTRGHLGEPRPLSIILVGESGTSQVRPANLSKATAWPG